MLKKLLTGIIIALAILGGIWGYFLYAGNPSIVRSRIENNRAYTAVFFISIIAIYILQGKNKLFRFLMFIIIFINVFILGDLFFRNNIGLDSRQFITLFGLILLGLATIYITHRIRYIIMGIIGLGVVFVLLTGILPMYETLPNINDFISSQKVKIINKGVTQGTLIIKNALGTKEIAIKDLNNNDIDISQTTQISFASQTDTNQGNLFIGLGNGSFITMSPQSAITLEQSGENTTMQILQGNIEYYVPDILSGTIKLLGKYTGKHIQDIKNIYRSNIISEFEQQKEEFFINQLGGNIVVNPVVNKIIKFFINTLYTISPTTYQENLNNYNTIQQYLGIDTTENTQNFTGTTIKNMIDSIMFQVKKGSEETRIIDQIFNK